MSQGPGDSGISTNLFITGFVSTSIQILLIREMMNISGGYELITGIFLGTWLITSAAGSSSQIQMPSVISENLKKNQM
ncbi:MAG TPA: hypothetical protein DD745_11025 [Bacteroidales bacterium]|nr:hypothetical protein [Bacteroidales bacterium]